VVRARAEIARFVGQRKLSVTADTYTHVLSDGRELDYDALLENVSGESTPRGAGVPMGVPPRAETLD
jgi:hypothetical protein